MDSPIAPALKFSAHHECRAEMTAAVEAWAEHVARLVGREGVTQLR